jgi:Pvc16 N-terminal domain
MATRAYWHSSTDVTVATPNAIAAVSEGVRRLLDDACPRTLEMFPGAEVKVYALEDFETRPVKTGLSLYLYRVAVNGPQRNRSARVTPDGRRLRPSLPVDLYYLLTPWAKDALVQQRLLGWAMRTLEDAAILSPGLLNAELPKTFLPSEAVELIADSLSLQDQSSLWQGFRSPWHLSAAYIARMVPLDSSIPVFEGTGPVITRDLDMHVRSEP